MNQSWVYMCPLHLEHALPSPTPPYPARLSQCPVSFIELALLSILHMVTYMFQCYFLKSSHFSLIPLIVKCIHFQKIEL